MDQFLQIISLPDNVPILLMGFLTAMFTCIAFYWGWKYDKIRAETGVGIREAALGPTEAAFTDRVTVWPHLVRIEMICAILLTVFLMVWSISLMAPLESPSNPNLTPNPSKAPWYFLGLQELLVYFDPWIAGVVLPNVIVVALMAIPYIDPNPKGNGYYSIKDRPFALAVYCTGFLVMWVSLIIIGTFVRGPGWMWFWPWEKWDPNRVEATRNVDLTEFLFGLPSAPYGTGLEPAAILGGLMLAGYTALAVAIPYAVLKKRHPDFLARWGFPRFATTAVLLGWMLGVVIKVTMRIFFNVKYFWVTPWFNV